METKAHKAFRRLRGMVHLSSGVQPEHVVFLAGAPRSGTTWVSDIINYRNTYRYMFEPFNREKVGLCRHFNFRQYLHPEDPAPLYARTIERVFEGRLRHPWTDQQNRRISSDRLLIKDVRSNLMLSWLQKRYPSIKFILLIRHPCAVAVSRGKFYNWQANLTEILEQRPLVTDYLSPFINDVRQAQGRFEEDIFLWCIDNFVPLQQMEDSDYHLMFYEDLCTEPESELARLAVFLGTPFDDDVWAVIRKPSLLTWADQTADQIQQGVRLVDRWCPKVTPEQLDQAVAILRLFGLDRFYAADPMPVARAGSGRSIGSRSLARESDNAASG